MWIEAAFNSHHPCQPTRQDKNLVLYLERFLVLLFVIFLALFFGTVSIDDGNSSRANTFFFSPQGYEAEQLGDFRVPDGYIRFPRRTAAEDDVATCEYCLEVRSRVIGGRPFLQERTSERFCCRSCGRGSVGRGRVSCCRALILVACSAVSKGSGQVVCGSRYACACMHLSFFRRPPNPPTPV